MFGTFFPTSAKVTMNLVGTIIVIGVAEFMIPFEPLNIFSIWGQVVSVGALGNKKLLLI